IWRMLEWSGLVQIPAAEPRCEQFEQFEQEKEPARVDCANARWGETEDERAAIVEHDGAIPREWAEGFARLDPDAAPADVPPKRWQRFIDDIGLFLDSPFCAVAAAL